MVANPVLAHSVRGNFVENRHRGAICVSDAAGNILASIGDVAAEVFPRSAIKAMQALPIFATGANARYGLAGPAIAHRPCRPQGVVCARGETRHLAQCLLWKTFGHDRRSARSG